MTRELAPSQPLVFWMLLSGFALMGCASSPSPDGSPPREDWLTQEGFYDRSSWPSVRLHRTRREMVSSRRLSDLFQGLEGISVHRSSIHGFGIEEIRQEGDGSCLVHVYVNGRRLHRSPTGERVSLDEFFPVRVMDGLEYHTAPDGPIFEEDGCGSLLLWSQELRTRQDRTLHTNIEGRVLSSPPDTVLQVELEPVGRRQAVGPAGEFAFRGLLPGEYEVVFLTDTGPIARLHARIFAFRDSRFDLEVGGGPENGVGNRGSEP